MKLYTIIASMGLIGFCFSASAATVDNVAVYATERSQGSISIGAKNAYTKTFEVALAKLSGDSVDLSKVCLKAYSSENKEFKLDTVDQALSVGSLKEGKTVKGIAVFSSGDEAVLKATLVKISDECS